MTTAWTGSLGLAVTTLVASAPWIAACGADAPGDHIVLGMGGSAGEGTFESINGGKTIALPLACFLLTPLEFEMAGVKRWRRASSVILDIAAGTGPTSTAYLASAQLAEDIANAFRDACDAGTFFAIPRITGPPILGGPMHPTILRNTWMTRLEFAWEIAPKT